MNNRKSVWNYLNNKNIFWLSLGVFVIVSFVMLYHTKQEPEELITMESENYESQIEAKSPSPALETLSNPSSEPEKTVASDQAIRVLITDSDDVSYDLENVCVVSENDIEISGDITATIPANETLNMKELFTEGTLIRLQPTTSNQKIQITSLLKNGAIPSYEGILEIKKTNDTFQIINEVDLETYLKYVVPSEMPSGYPLEALKAQAVCARTYAVRQMKDQSLAAYGADADDTVNFQVYAHIARQTSTDQAVDETAGQIMLYEGEPIQAYFFSTSCGFTSGDEVWNMNGSIPYLNSVAISDKSVEAGVNSLTENGSSEISETIFADFIKEVQDYDYEREEAWYRWNVTYTWDSIKARVQEQYPEIGEIQNFEVLQRSDGGAIIKLLLQGTQGSAVLDTEYNIRKFFVPQNEVVILTDGSQAPKQALLPSAYFTIQTLYENGQKYGIQLFGGGYGHGVGMSQNGARHLAEQGKNWQEIVKVFYQNIDIQGIESVQ